MSQDIQLGTDTVAEAYPKVNGDIAELFVNLAEVVAARDGETDLLAQINALQASITALTASNGSAVSANDTTPGYLNGKLLAGDNITFTVGTPAGDETLTIASANKPYTSLVKTGDYTITIPELDGTVTVVNTSAIAAVDISLIEAVVGYELSFFVNAAQYLRATAFGTNTISYGRDTGAAGGYVRSNVAGTYWTLKCIVAGKWEIIDLTDDLKFDM